MNLKKNVSVLLLFCIALLSCDDNKKSNDEIAEKERIVFEKTADSMEQINNNMDTLNTKIKNTSAEIDALLDEINQ